MILSDFEIAELAEKGMITPFHPDLISKADIPDVPGHEQKIISYGTSSYGYDIRLSPNDFAIFKPVPGQIINPKCFDPGNLESVPLQTDSWGHYFVLPRHTYGLGVALECLNVPDDVTVLCIGKSTYARIGIIANLTPAEAGWRGHLTLEFSNSTDCDCRIFANEGIVQLLFFRGKSCLTTYEDRKGKYQDQLEQVTAARML